MRKENLKILGPVLIFGVIILLALFFVTGKNEVTLCRNIFKGLIQARQSVQKYIDWENFKALGLDIGATYNKFPNDKEKSDYRREFIKNLSSGFKRQGGRFNAFSGWRIYKRSDEGTVVAADYKAKAKTMLFTLSGSGYPRKLTAIQWGNVGE